MPRSESQKQLDELAKQEAAESSPPVANYGTIAPDIIKQHKVQAMEAKMSTAERKQYQRERTSKYGYPPVK